MCAFHFIIACISTLLTVYAHHVCLLRERLDHSTGTARWSLPSEERCYCTRVVAPKFLSVNKCAEAARVEGKVMWFVDDPKPLTEISNWNATMLDMLLERADFCWAGTLLGDKSELIYKSSVNFRLNPFLFLNFVLEYHI